MDIKEKIDRFKEVFDDSIQSIYQLELDKNDEKYRKILFFSILDALAKARFPQEKRGEAVRSFVTLCCDWPAAEKVSLPHVVAMLERTADTRFQTVKEQLFPRLRLWGGPGIGGHGRLDEDPEKAEMEELWPIEKGKPLPVPELKLTWRNAQHCSLIWAYRNTLVHESRSPTASFETKGDQEPYYWIFNLSDRTKWPEFHLVYPSSFLRRLCERGICNLRKHLLEDNQDPYTLFTFGRYLIGQLNDQSRYPIIESYVRPEG